MPQRLMATTVTRTSLHRALATVARAVAARSPVPATACVHLASSGSRLSVQATDLDLRITTETDLTGPFGTACVPHKLLADWVGAVPSSEIGLTLNAHDVRLVGGDYAATVKGMDPAAFPPPPAWGDHTHGWTVDAHDLHPCLAAVVGSVAKDDSRPVFHGVYIGAPANGDVTLAAADGFRLSVSVCAAVTALPADGEAVVVPISAVQAMINILAGAGPGTNADVRICKTHIALTVGDTTVTARLIEGTFPNYSQIIPATLATTATVNRKELIAALKTAQFVAREASGIVRLAFGDGRVALTSTAESVGTVTAEVLGTIDGPDVAIGFNVAFVLDALTALPGDTVVVGMNGPTTPGVFRAPDCRDTHVIMPMHVAR